MSKIDLHQLHKAEYATPGKPALIEVKPAQYLAIRGSGKPGGAEFQAAIGTLYNVAFTVKMISKFAGSDYGVCKLEGLYPSFDEWTLIIRTPDFIDAGILSEAVTKLKAKGKTDGISDVKLKKLDEGRCVQVLHSGSFDKEGPVIAAMAAFAAENGCRPRGDHHEIYLSDPRKVSPDKFRTILRQPVRAT